MAKIVDAEEYVTREATVVTDEPEAIEEYANIAEEAEAKAEAPVEEAPEVAEEPVVADDLPEKYQGKSTAEIARMHQELEKRLGQQSQEVGELRRHFDDYVQSSISSQQSSAPEAPVEDVDFFADPAAAVAQAIENHPSLQQAQQVAAEMAKSQALAKLKTAHPDMDVVLQDEKFKEWVGASDIRVQMYQDADQRYDFAKANELLNLYKERATVVKQTEAVEKQARKNEVKKASTGTARSNPEGASPKKVYRRRDIIELMNSDPKRYEALMPEIMKAYAEGRVK
jgi:hypothetical protein